MFSRQAGVKAALAAVCLNYKALASLLAEPLITAPYEPPVESRFSVIRGARMT